MGPAPYLPPDYYDPGSYFYGISQSVYFSNPNIYHSYEKDVLYKLRCLPLQA